MQILNNGDYEILSEKEKSFYIGMEILFWV